MTPQQQKAKELVEKFYKAQVKILNKEGCTEIESVEMEIAKQCALIACDEMIQQNGELYLNGMDGEYYRTKNAFLFDVKQEITQLI